MENTFSQNSNIEEEPINQTNLINFGTYFEILIRRKKIFTLVGILFFIISSSNLIYRRIKKPIYEGSFTVMISDPFINNRTADNSLADLALNRETLDIPTLVQYLKSPEVVSNVAIKNGLSPLNLINTINISVPSSVGRYLSQTLLISIEGTDTLKMKKILKDLSEQYIIKASESRNEKLSEGINFLNLEKPKLLLKVKKAQESLENFRLENEVIDPVSEGNNIVNLIEQNKNSILAIESENLRLSYIKENLVNGILYTQGLSSSSSSQGAGLGVIGSDQLLLEEILQVKSDLADAQSKYKKSSSIVKNLDEKLSQLEPILFENQKLAIEAAIIFNNSIIKSHENQISKLKKKFTDIPSKVTKYSTILENLQTYENNLITLNETKDKLELDLSQGILPWKIIKEPLVNPSPIKPKIQRNLIYVLFYSLGIAGLITLLVERFDNVFHNVKEIEKFINLPILGFVPFFNFKDDDDDEFIDDPKINNLNKDITLGNILDDQKNYNDVKFILEETFRNIYTSIKFSKSDKEIKIVNITSTIPEEGKSLCSLLLATNISQIQKKVLLIDTDLRKPSLHKRLEVDNVTGISNFLVSKENDWAKYINTHESYKNLSYMTAGKIPPNSISLLESNKMKTFINELRNSKQYDFIIFDCPPILGLSDSLLISNYVDASILTVSLNKVNKQLAMGCLEKLRLIKKPLIGTIVNRTSEDKNKNLFSNNYYSYNNQYNYFSYKYMPMETQMRYMNKETESVEKKDKLKNYLNIKNYNSKVKSIFDYFLRWLNE